MLKISNRLLFDEAQKRGLKPQVMDPFNSFISIDAGGPRYLRSSLTSLSSAPALHIAGDKSTFYRLCVNNKLPIPETMEYESREASQPFLEKHGILVVKPSGADHGDGVTVGVRELDELDEAVAVAREFSNRVILQKLIKGVDHRLLVVDGVFVAASLRKPPVAVGDATHTLAELIEIMNSSELRGDGHTQPMTKINILEVIDYLGGAEIDRILGLDEEVVLLGTANLSRGGYAENITDSIPLKVREMAEEAARICGLGICGVDIMSEDIADESSPFYLLEVNATPGLRMHHFPAIGEPVDVAKLIIDAVVTKATVTSIGRVEKIDFPKSGVSGVHAKIDTGAYRSSVWATDIRVDDGRLYFKLLGQESEFYSGKEMSVSEFEEVEVENSFGNSEQRYSIMMSIRMAGRRVRTNVTLSDRKDKTYPILIGRKLLRKKFIVDVSTGMPLPDEEKK